MTTTNYIGIGVLITTFFIGLTNFINSIRLKDIHSLVNGQASAQNLLIATLYSQLDNKTKEVSDTHETVAILAEGNKK